MRTLNEDFTVAADNDGVRYRNYNYNTNSNSNNGVNTTANNIQNNGYNSQNIYSNIHSNSNNNNSNSAIPYHARENSLPFSYGQVGKTSTPLKSVVNSAGASGYRSVYGNNHNIDNYESSSYLRNLSIGNDNRNVNGNSSNDIKYNGLGLGTGSNGGTAYRDISDNYRKYGNETTNTDGSMIKPQPRLKSPLLVRKTLNSHSPTRAVGPNATANTISNTYHFGNTATNGNSYGFGTATGTGRLSPTTNGNAGLNNNFYGQPINATSTSTTTRRIAPACNDLEDLLRERRERVYNEYIELPSTRPLDAVVPPPRQFRSEDTTDAATSASTRHRKYNYDFEFHLNLDEDWPAIGKVPPQPPVRRTSSNALDHYNNIGNISNSNNNNNNVNYNNHNGSNTFSKREQLEREQYRTRDIELPPLKPRDVERNYHTINSSTSYTTSNASQFGVNQSNQIYQERERPSPSMWLNNGSGNGRDNATERFFETYEQRRQQTQSLPQPQLQPQPQRQQLQPQTVQQQQQQQRAEYTTTTAYGNGNAAGYAYNGNGSSSSSNGNNNIVNESTTIYRSSLNATPTAATKAAAAAAPIYATTTKQVAKSSASATTSSTDYPSPRSMASPGTPLFSRPETPAFPVTPRTPFGTIQNGYSPNGRRFDHSLSNNSQQFNSEMIYQMNSPRSRLNSGYSVATTNAELQEVAAHLVKFAKDSSKFWYKPNLSRDDAISLLINAAPGTFVVRDSTTYKNAYGLVVRVAQPPPNTNATGKPDELVRHFLIEPTTRGVRLKGCTNEPVFTSLSALVYEHSINQLALPCLLRIPEDDLVPPLVEPTPAQKQLLTQGAACNILWLFSCDTESLTGEEAIRKAIRQMYAQKVLPSPTEVHFKVSQQGITLTDNTRKKFFRKHYASEMISFCAIDPDHRMWTIQEQQADQATGTGTLSKNATVGSKKTIFAFVARRSPSCKDNQCHVFCDLATNQPASAIVSFANKTLPTEKQRNYVL